jgi:hypothetical protein
MRKKRRSEVKTDDPTDSARTEIHSNPTRPF